MLKFSKFENNELLEKVFRLFFPCKKKIPFVDNYCQVDHLITNRGQNKEKRNNNKLIKIIDFVLILRKKKIMNSTIQSPISFLRIRSEFFSRPNNLTEK